MAANSYFQEGHRDKIDDYLAGETDRWTRYFCIVQLQTKAWAIDYQLQKVGAEQDAQPEASTEDKRSDAFRTRIRNGQVELCWCWERWANVTVPRSQHSGWEKAVLPLWTGTGNIQTAQLWLKACCEASSARQWPTRLPISPTGHLRQYGGMVGAGRKMPPRKQ